VSKMTLFLTLKLAIHKNHLTLNAYIYWRYLEHMSKPGPNKGL
jgi:hypothetical protein